MDNAMIEILKFKDLFPKDLFPNNDKGSSILFFIILNKILNKYQLSWSYCFENDKDYPSLGFCLEESYKKKIILNHSKDFDNIRLEFYNYNGKEIKSILKYIKKNNKIVDNTNNV